MVLLDLCGVTGFTSGLLSSLAMNLSAGAGRTGYPVLYLLAAAEIAVYFMVFTFLIRRFDLRTPGREAPVTTEAPAGQEGGFPFRALVAALGGRDNIVRVDNCLTRLRVWVLDPERLDEKALRSLAPDGLSCHGREVQLVFGFDAEQLRAQLDQLLEKNALST